MLKFHKFAVAVGNGPGSPDNNPNLVPILKPMASPLITTQPQKKYTERVKIRMCLAQNSQRSQTRIEILRFTIKHLGILH